MLGAVHLDDPAGSGCGRTVQAALDLGGAGAVDALDHAAPERLVLDARAHGELAGRDRSAPRRRLTLVILSQGDASLRNNYHVYAVNPARHPQARRAEAHAFIDFLVSDAVQRTIATFKRDELGESLFFPDALASGSTR